MQPPDTDLQNRETFTRLAEQITDYSPEVLFRQELGELNFAQGIPLFKQINAFSKLVARKRWEQVPIEHMLTGIQKMAEVKNKLEAIKSFSTRGRSSPEPGRVGRRRDRFRPMASVCIRPFGHRGKQPSGHANVSSAPSIHSVRRVFPSTAGSQPCPPAPFRNPSRLRLTPELPFTRFWPFRIQASGTAAAPTGPWLSAVYHVRAC